MIVLFNMALDPTGPLAMRLHARPRRVSQVTAQGSRDLPARPAGGELRVAVPSIPAWQTAVLVDG